MPKTENKFTAIVRDVTSDGRGVVSNPEGKTCFVAGVWPGEEGVFSEQLSNSKVGNAKLEELTLSSPYRVEAPCIFHGHNTLHCGGCPWQFMEYEAQLRLKQEKIIAAFERSGIDVEINTIFPSEKIYSYRNRAQLKTDGMKLGYMASQSNSLVDITDCLVLSDKNRNTLKDMRANLPNDVWKIKNKNKKASKWTTLDIDESTTSDNVSVNQRLPFRQANDQQNEVMRNWLKQKIESCSAESKVLELFCGSGNFTSIIAEKGFAGVLAVEGDQAAIDTLNGRQLNSTEALSLDLYSELELDKLLRKAKNVEVLVLDPPRDGLKHAQLVLKKLKKLKKVIYISCDLATFVRDLKAFTKTGFQVLEVQPLDQFPHTPHIELMAVLKR